MCIEVRKTCCCGKHNVQFHLRDNIMSSEVILSLYCPNCSPDIPVHDEAMVCDKNWIIEYDMELAQFLAAARLNLAPDVVDPAFLFDAGYATWLELYPGEKEDILAERKDIMELAKTDPRKYLETINSWNISRVERLKADGWRKAQAT
ncbi:MAG: hypothetical protein SCH71_01025 [Desulfobulbaceae bacterium]|nr:hypothetical protein [Desulfobulbaceae bacterium]